MFRFLIRQSTTLAFIEALTLLFAISWLDLATGHQVSVVLFYTAPIVLAVWLCDNKSVFVIAGLGVAEHRARVARENQVVSELLDQHVSTLASATPVDVVSTDRHTVKPWFAGKIPFTFNLPELQGTPFELAGGRMSYLEQAPGAELIFKIRKHQLSVFIYQARAVAADFPASDARDAQAFHLESWTQGDLRYFAVGDASADDLRALRSLLENAK